MKTPLTLPVESILHRLPIALFALVAAILVLTGVERANGAPPPSNGNRYEIRPLVVGSFTAGVGSLSEGLVKGSDECYYGVSTNGGALGSGCFYKVNPIGSVVTVLASFGDPSGGDARGTSPVGVLAYDGSTYYYGVTRGGGRFDRGTIFRTTQTGTVTTLVDFSGAEGAAPGARPNQGLTFGADGNLYGTYVDQSGPNATGSTGVFRVSPDGRYAVLARFTGTGGVLPGVFPDGPLLALADGSLLGTTRGGGKAEAGTIYRVRPDGSVISVAAFTAATGGIPTGTIVELADHSVYGIGLAEVGARFGGNGFIWKLSPTGTLSTLLTFGGSGNAPTRPVGGLTAGPGGNLLAVLTNGGPSSVGGVYSITPAGAVSLYADFSAVFSGFSANAQSPLIADGMNFVGTAPELAYRIDGSQTLSKIGARTPDAGTNAGAVPVSTPFFGAVQTLYVRTDEGGANGEGTIAMITSGGIQSTLASLPSGISDSANGANAPVQDGAGNLLLVDRFGGPSGQGAILQIDGSGVITTRASFSYSSAVESLTFPAASLTGPDASGNFYGQCTLYPPGSLDSQDAVYRLSAANVITKYGVVDPTGSSFAQGPLLLQNDGRLFGVVGFGLGRVFTLAPGAPSATTFTLFGTATNNARYPEGGIYRDGSGNFVFAAYQPNSQNGTAIVRVNANGIPSRVATIPATAVGLADNILSPLSGDTKGRLYGVYRDGGAYGGGVLFSVDAAGAFHTVYDFRIDGQPGAIGLEPSGGLVAGPPGEGAIYGVTRRGGPGGGGAVYKFFTSPGSGGVTDPPANVQANSVDFSASFSTSGYAGEYWFSYDTVPPTAEVVTPRVAFGGFHGTESVTQSVAGLKGHTTYSVQFHADVGVGNEGLEATIKQFITPNGAPVPQDDAILVGTGSGPYIGNVLDNDRELDGDSLTITAVTNGSQGTVTITPDQKVAYTPNGVFSGSDSFTYTVSDSYSGGALTATATVNVFGAEQTPGEYAGLLVDIGPEGTLPIPREAAREGGSRLLPSANQIAAGFASIAVAKGGGLSARFDVGGRSIATRGTVKSDRDTVVTGQGGRFGGRLTPLPNGFSATITYNGRMLVLVAGRGFFEAGVTTQPVSDFTMRLEPDQVADPVNGDGIPAGDGYAVIRKGAKSRRTIIGALPDGTAFSASSVVDANGQLPYLARIYAKKGTLDGQLAIAPSGTIDPVVGTDTHWVKPAAKKEKRFPGGFAVTLTAYGNQYTVPKADEPIGLADGAQLAVAFDRGGLFAPVSTRFTAMGAKLVFDPANDAAKARVAINARTGVAAGTFRPFGKLVKFRGVVVQRGVDHRLTGFFVGPADTGVVDFALVP